MKFFFASGYQLFYGFLILLSLAFALFGILVLRIAYHLEEPGYFILFFFAANFIILLSITFAIISFFRIRTFRSPPSENKDNNGQSSPGDHSTGEKRPAKRTAKR
ncbi:hypothetical protein OOT00_11935 [Desulfobotulus sp. H1]|uniref:Uncharacterized protein n=1 Tax=Desulfobotulus pelophilus TaxID=2823377 RepID=A0ABT3NB50_9BACT|nr:hypothetical protein [Desulfobotulus pelophilus]MCW7754691.1 hypothetical protein [Desulfobotulus pelophilus]